MSPRLPQPRSSICRAATVATASLAALCALQAVSAAPPGSNGDRLAIERRHQDPFEYVDLPRPITVDAGYFTVGLGNSDAVSQAVGQSGEVYEDSGDDAADEGQAAHTGGKSAGSHGASVDEIFAGNGHASISDDENDIYAGWDGAWIGDRSVDDKSQQDSPPSSSATAAAAASPSAKGGEVVWTWEAGALGCPGVEDSNVKICSATYSAGSTPSLEARMVKPTGRNDVASPSRLSALTAAAGPTPTPAPASVHLHRRQSDLDAVSASSSEADIFPQFTSYLTLTHATSSYVYFGPNSNLNTSVAIHRSRAISDSGNGEAPTNINNPDSPDLGWLDTIVGGVPYKNGDLAASVVWILATICLIPLLLIRLIRRSSLISSVLFTIVVFMILMLFGFGMRAKLSDQTPTTGLMMAMSIILAILLPLLLEPLLALLALYSGQSGRPTGVPTAAAVLRVLNVVVFILFLVAAAYDASWMKQWDDALRNRYTAQNLPPIQPPGVVRIAPVVASIIEMILILGTALLIPVARGDNGRRGPGGFIFLLLVLLFIACVYRILQTLHATARLSEENGGTGSSSDLLPFFSGGSSSSTTDDERVANGLSLAPQGMYGPKSKGIAWEQLQLTMASRGTPQTPVIFNLVYVLPMWLMLFLLFFAHAPGKKADENNDDGDATATAVASA